jgi:hypothetical protein
MSYRPAGPGRHASGPAGPAAGQVTEAGRWLGQEPAPGADQVQVIPSGEADTPADAGAGDCGDDGLVGCHDGLGADLSQVVQEPGRAEACGD